MLINDKRAGLFDFVLKQITLLYKRRNKILSFTISTAHPLTQEAVESVKQFLERVTGCDIIYEYKIDKSLIAGMRLQSETLLWEHSVKKNLQCVRLSRIR